MHINKFENEFEALPYLVKGSAEAFSFIYRTYSQRIYMNIFKYVKNVDLAEDVLQEVFLTLWQHRAEIHCDRSVGGWLFTVSYNKSIALLKSQIKAQMLKEQTAYLADSLTTVHASEETEYQQQVKLLQEAVNCLPPKKRQVYRLNKFENKKPEEISEQLGLTVISVKHYIKQSTKLIKKYVQLKYPIDIILLLFALLKEMHHS